MALIWYLVSIERWLQSVVIEMDNSTGCADTAGLVGGAFCWELGGLIQACLGSDMRNEVIGVYIERQGVEASSLLLWRRMGLQLPGQRSISAIRSLRVCYTTQMAVGLEKFAVLQPEC
jgi:hypothetical protein